MREVQHEPAELEKAINELRERHRSDTHHAGLKLESRQKQQDSWEAELGRVQELLNETERKLQTEAALMRSNREENTNVVAKLEAEKSSAKEKLLKTREQEQKFSARLAEMQRGGSSEQARLTGECTDLMRLRDLQLRESEARLEALRKERKGKLVALEDRLGEEFELQRRALGAAGSDNSRYRRLVGDAGGGPEGRGGRRRAERDA